MNEDSIEQQLPPELLEEYENLKQSFLNRLKITIPELRTSFDNFINDQTLDNLKLFYSHIHKLSGSAGMYGFNNISENCHEIAGFLKPILTDFSSINENIKDLLTDKYNFLNEILKNYEGV